MTVKEALKNRFSCRFFLDDPISDDVLNDILKSAFCSPSCENSQPWEIYIAGPETMDKIREEFENNRKQKIPMDLDRRFDGNWTEEMLPRINDYFDEIYEHEPRKNLDYTLQKRNLFYAPAMIFLCIDNNLPTWSVFDTGIFAQSLMLAATEHGLATMPSAVSVAYPQLLHELLKIPENSRIIIGIGIGYPDLNHSINQFRTTRKSTDEIHRLP